MRFSDDDAPSPCHSRPTVLSAHSLQLFAAYTLERTHFPDSQAGVQQGDTCGPLFFALTLLIPARELSALPITGQSWYLDDGGTVGRVEALEEVLSRVGASAPSLGLELNLAKCMYSSPSGPAAEGTLLTKAKFVP